MIRVFTNWKRFFMLDYTERSRILSFKYPKLSVIIIHVMFWQIAFFVISMILHLFSRSASILLEFEQPNFDWYSGIVAAGIYGVATGWVYLKLKNSRLNRVSVWWRLMVETIIYTAVYIAVIYILYSFWEDQRLAAWQELGIEEINTEYMKYILLAIFFYTTVLNFLLGFFMQMRAKFGPGVLLPIFLGRYRKPRIDYRIFMFMDLKSSTTYAETLGHLKYSELIQDCFRIVNRVVRQYRAEIFQYVGDEVVLTWQENDVIDPMDSVDFFFSFQDAIHQEDEYFQKKYGLLPEFKAGIHNGVITAIEVGEVKREIAFHGDTINTASRIQSVCNQYNSKLLISDRMKDKLAHNEKYRFTEKDSVVLKGKHTPLTLFAVERI